MLGVLKKWIPSWNMRIYNTFAIRLPRKWVSEVFGGNKGICNFSVLFIYFSQHF